MQVENDVVFSSANFQRCSLAFRKAFADRNYFINRVETFQNRRDPIFKQDIDLLIRKKSF